MRATAIMVRQLGGVRRTRGARAPHSGQADGSSHSAIARSCVNGPHLLHIYSYVGIDHLPPVEPHPPADRSAAIVEAKPAKAAKLEAADSNPVPTLAMTFMVRPARSGCTWSDC
jgi:hypothetical protein